MSFQTWFRVEIKLF